MARSCPFEPTSVPCVPRTARAGRWTSGAETGDQSVSCQLVISVHASVWGYHQQGVLSASASAARASVALSSQQLSSPVLTPAVQA